MTTPAKTPAAKLSKKATNGIGEPFTEEKWSTAVLNRTPTNVRPGFAQRPVLGCYNTGIMLCVPFDVYLAYCYIHYNIEVRPPKSTNPYANLLSVTTAPASPSILKMIRDNCDYFDCRPEAEMINMMHALQGQLVWCEILAPFIPELFFDYIPSGNTKPTSDLKYDTTRLASKATNLLPELENALYSLGYHFAVDPADIVKMANLANSVEKRAARFTSNADAIKRYKRIRTVARKHNAHPALWHAKHQHEMAERMFARQLGVTPEAAMRLTTAISAAQKCLEYIGKTNQEILDSNPESLKAWARKQRYELNAVSLSSIAGILERRIKNAESMSQSLSNLRRVEEMLAAGQGEACKLELLIQCGYVVPGPDEPIPYGQDISKL